MEMSHAVEVTRALQGYRYLNLTTFRKNSIPVVTMVWFAHMDESISVWTAKTSGKVKRIRNSSTIQIAPSTHLGRPCGPDIEGRARILSVGEQQAAEQLMNPKYGWQKRVFALIWRLQGREQVYIEITPTQA
jgi:PPOX class probable F420-dependent enzyme